MSISGSLCGFFSMILIRSPFDTKSKFAISSELKISDTKRKTNNVKQKNGALFLRNAALPRARISEDGSVVFPFWRIQCQKVATS